MNHNIKEIVDDKRPIKSIAIPGIQESFTIGYDCDQIKAYWENGQSAIVPFLAVIKLDETTREKNVIFRCPAHWASIRYEIKDS